MKDSPGAALGSQIGELGADLLDRTDRLAADLAHINAQIANVQSRVAAIMAVGAVFLGLLFCASVAHVAGLIK